MKVVFATPSLSGPTAPYIKSLEQSIPLVTAAGWEESYVQELQNPYISAARSIMTRKALDAGADVIVYLDYDLSWDAEDLLKLLETDGDVVAGTYRYKKPEVEYMGEIISNPQGTPLVRKDGAVAMNWVPAGFLKVTRKAIQRFMRAYPQLVYGDPENASIDLFNHGAHQGVWYGEDVAFCRNWKAIGGEVWMVPNLNINHHTSSEVFTGNIHEFLLRQPGGSHFKESQHEKTRIISTVAAGRTRARGNAKKPSSKPSTIS